MRNLIIVPVFNEENTLEKVFNQIRKFHPGDILAINDGSTDRSMAILGSRRDILILDHPRNTGYGQSLIDGYRYACDTGYEFVVTIDCDEQHEPSLIPVFLREIGDTDILSGTRYLCESNGNDPPPQDRRNINRIVTEAINRVTGYTLTDSFCGFKCIRVSALDRMRLTVPGYGIPVQFWLQAKYQGLTVREYAIPRIYKNLNRKFGSGLDDPETRLAYYKSILQEEAKRCSFEIPEHLFAAVTP